MFFFLCFVVVASTKYKMGKYSFDIERKHVSRSLLSGSYRNHNYTPTGSTSSGFTMTPLDDYVSRPDHVYKWEELPYYYEAGDLKVHILNLTSQSWLDDAMTSQTIWYHYLMVIIPDELSIDEYALLYNTGSNTGTEPPENDPELMLNMVIAAETGSIVGCLYQVPNQPIKFYDDKPKPRSRTEDSLVGYSWVHYLKNLSEPEIIVNLPMTKAVVRSMDAIEEYLRKLKGLNIQEWIVLGASKRGSNTWTTAAYDGAHENRVVAIIPMVYSFVNLLAQIHHWWMSMGNWSFAFQDYYDCGLTEYFDTPEFDSFQNIVDPYVYTDRYKDKILYQMMSSDDEFFMFNDPRYYWDSLNFKEKHMLAIENSEHSLISGFEAWVPSIISFLQSIHHDVERPKLEFIIDYDTGDTHLTTSESPDSVHVWWGVTAQSSRIDFRWLTKEFPCQFAEIQGKCVQPIFWFRKEAVNITSTQFRSHFEPMEDGRWIGSFMHAEFSRPGLLSHPFLFSTVGSITPYQYPFPDCHGMTCKGRII